MLTSVKSGIDQIKRLQPNWLLILEKIFYGQFIQLSSSGAWVITKCLAFINWSLFFLVFFLPASTCQPKRISQVSRLPYWLIFFFYQPVVSVSQYFVRTHYEDLLKTHWEFDSFWNHQKTGSFGDNFRENRCKLKELQNHKRKLFFCPPQK